MRRTYIIIGGLIFVALIAAGGFFAYQSWKQADNAHKKAEAFARGDITLYLYNRQHDTDASGTVRCSASSLEPVVRTVGAEKTNLNYTLALILSGDVSEAERAQGYLPLYPLDYVKLSDANLGEDGTLLLSFTVTSTSTPDACTMKLVGAMLQKTLTQFPSVHQLNITPHTLFGA